MVEYFSFLFGCAFSLISYKTFKVAKRIYPYFLGNSYLNKINPKSLNIAVISGSTDGLGKSFVERLHRNNFNVFLLGRSQSKLSKVIEQFKQSQSQQNKNELIPYIVDFSHMKLCSSVQQVNQITNLLQNKIKSQSLTKFKQIKIIFINSCGDAHISPYEDTDLQEIERIQAVNINSFHFMLQVLFRLKSLEIFKNLNFPKQYAFVNVSSGVDQNPNLYSSIYSGSKSYCSNVMKVLYGENKAKEKSNENQQTTYFLNLTPLYIKTKMIRYLKQRDVVQPEQIVEGAFKLLKRRSEGSGSFTHEILKQFPLLMRKTFQQRVNKASQFRNRMIQIENKRKNRKKKDL